MTPDTPAMDTERVDELDVLRARAYGPAADIDDDPAAIRRLEELEGRRTPRAPTLDDAKPVEPVEVTPDGTSGTAPTSQPTPPEVALPERAPDVIAAPPWRLAPGFKLLWVFTVVAAALIAASITWTVAYLAPVAVSSGAEQIATLTPSRNIDIPAGWFGAGASSLTFEYSGLVLFETSYSINGSGGENCFAIAAKEQLPESTDDPNGWSMNGGFWTACGVGAFPATAELSINSSVPGELRSQFPDGSALQFVLDGDRVGVFLDPAE